MVDITGDIIEPFSIKHIGSGVLAMKNLAQKFAQLAAKYKPNCDPAPGKWNSCEPCKNCGKRAKFPESGETPPTPCCIITPPLVFEFEYDNRGVIYSNTITINVNCPTRLYFTAYQIVGNTNDSFLFIKYNGVSDNQLDEGNPVIIDVVNGDTLQFYLVNSPAPSGAISCWECYVYNETCNIQNTLCLNNFCIQ